MLSEQSYDFVAHKILLETGPCSACISICQYTPV